MLSDIGQLKCNWCLVASPNPRLLIFRIYRALKIPTKKEQQSSKMFQIFRKMAFLTNFDGLFCSKHFPCATSDVWACIVTSSCEGDHGFDSPPEHGYPWYPKLIIITIIQILASYDEVYYSWHNSWTQKLLLEIISSYRACLLYTSPSPRD